MEPSESLLEEYEFTIPSLSVLSDAGHPFSVPWDQQTRAILGGFDSANMKTIEGPWKLSSPFELRGATVTSLLPETGGGISTFRDGFSTSSGASTEHLSAALGVTVGYPFLNASVSGKYDKSVMMNSHGVKASRNATCRAGRIVLASTPILTVSALELLDRDDGPAQFRNAFGDYYVFGYQLGADAGCCMSASTESTTTAESLEITVSVKVLFYKASVSHKGAWSAATSASSISYCGFNSLEQKMDELKSPGNASAEAQEGLQMAAAECLRKVASLDSAVRESIAKLGIQDGKTFPLSVCPSICTSGLVVEILLAPYARLNQYVAQVSRMKLKTGKE